MKRISIASATAFLVLAILAVGCQSPDQNTDSEATDTPGGPLPIAASEGEPPSSLYGRITTYDGTTYEGPLRWGGGEEAFWGHYFNGVKDENPWAIHTPLGRTAEKRRPKVFGIELPWGEGQTDLRRPFMARFGDIVRIESVGDGVAGVLASGVDFAPAVRVTLKSGTVFDLDRLEASDFDDGVGVWDDRRGAVYLGPREIRTVELLAPDSPREVPDRLYGTVRTRQGDFTGFLQWDREEAIGRDELVGRTEEGEVRLRFDALRSIARDPQGGSLATTRDGHEIALSGTRKVGSGNRGVYVDDQRYGRVLVSWDAFERVDFSPGGPSPSYRDFSPGRPLMGSVTTRDGRRLTGQLVYDLDESETTETLDAPARGVDYTIPFGRIASIVLLGREEREAGRATAPASVTLQSGEELGLERAGDLGEDNAGVLILAGDGERSEYVPWGEVERIDFDSPSAVSSPPVAPESPGADAGATE